MALSGEGDDYQVTLDVRYKGEEISSIYITQMGPGEAKELFEKAKTERTIEFTTTSGEAVLIYTDALKHLKRKTTMEKKKEEKNEEPNQKGPQAKGKSGEGQDKK